MAQEQWGERWEVLQQCLRTYNPALGELANYFARAWRYKWIDKLRRENLLKRGGDRGHMGLDKALFKLAAPKGPDPAPDWRGDLDSVMIEVKKDPLLHEYLGLICRGCSEKQARLALGGQGPGRTTMWRIRVRMARKVLKKKVVSAA